MLLPEVAGIMAYSSSSISAKITAIRQRMIVTQVSVQLAGWLVWITEVRKSPRHVASFNPLQTMFTLSLWRVLNWCVESWRYD